MTHSMVSFRHYFFVAALVSLLLFLVLAPNVGAASPTLEEQHQLAALSVKLSALKTMLNNIYSSLFKGSLAQVSSACSSSLIALLGDGCHYMYNDSSGNAIYCDGPMTKSAKAGDAVTNPGCSSSTYSSGTTPTSSCPSGYYYMSQSSGTTGYCVSNTNSTICQPVGGGATYTCPTTTTPTSSNYCDTALINLLGSGCHQMYYDSANNPIFCDGSNTKSAKRGDTVTTSGCSYGSSTGTTSSCPSGYTYTSPSSGSTAAYCQSNTSGTTCQPLGGGTIYTCPTTTTQPQNVPPVISSINATPTSNSVTITWITDKSSNSKVEYWISTVTGDFKSDPNFVTNHIITIFGLQASTTYTYNVISEDANYYRGTASNKTFTTLSFAPPQSTTPPLAPSGLTATLTPTAGSAGLSWSDVPEETEFKIHRRLTGGTWVMVGTVGANIWAYTDSGLAQGNYEYHINACNSYGCSADSATVAFNVTTGTTTTPTGSNSCDTALINLLGSGCHQMYYDSANNPIFCDGPMTKSAKRGDTVTTSGCSYGSSTGTTSSCPSGYTYTSPSSGSTAAYCQSNTSGTTCQPLGGGTIYTCPTTTTPITPITGSNSCDTALINLLGSGCHQMYYDSANNPIFCDGSNTKSAKRGDTVTTSGCSYSTHTTATTTSSYAPGVPTNLTAQASGKDVKLTWVDVISETEYKIFRKSSTVGTWSFLASLAADSISYINTNVPDGSYEYLIQACSSYGCSRDSNLATASVSGIVVSTKTPAVTLISPNTGSIGTVVIVSGSNILATSNQINFEGGVIRDLSSSDGKTVTFSVPDDRVPLCAVTEPRCLLPAPYNPVKPGTYNVSLTNSNGTSNSLTFTVTEKTTSCPSGYHYMTPFAGTATGYCMTDTDTTVCQPLGGGAKYTCSGYQTATTTITIGDTTPPSLDYSQVSPRSGDSNVPVTTKIHVVFNEDIDPTSFGANQFFSLYEANYSQTYSYYTSYTSYASPTLPPSVPGKFTILSNGFDFIPDAPLKAGASYTWQIFGGVKDRVGNKSSAYYQETFRTALDSSLGTGSISGKVLDGKNNIVLDASINLSNFSYSFWRNANSGKDGSYKFTDIPVGSYRLSLYNPSSKTALISPPDVTVTVSKGVDLNKDLSFIASTKTIKGTIKTSAGVSITDARIKAYRQDGPGWAETETDSIGAFSLTLSGGTWQLGAWPKDYSRATWTSDKISSSVTFLNDSTVETKTVNLVVLSQNSKIIGKLLKPGGIVPAPYEASINVSASDRSYPGSELSSDGSFSVAVAAGTYEVFVWSQDQTIKVAPITVTVVDGETKDIGTIRLTRPAEKITGKVSDQTGAPVIGANVNAYQTRGGGYSTAKTDLTGVYSLSLTAGIWTVSVSSDSSSQYTNIDPPEEVEVKTGGTVVKNLRVSLLDAAISGVVKDSSGAVVEDFYGYAYVEGATKYGGMGGSVSRGTFTFKVPSGLNRIALDVPPGSGFTSGGAVEVTASKGETVQVTLIIRKNTSGISGLVVDAKGNAIIGAPIRVFASGGKGSWQEATVDTATGRFQIKVSSGTWFLGASSYESGFGGKYFQRGRDIKVEVPEGKIVTQNVIFTTSDATIKGVVKKADGTLMPNIWVSVDSRSHSTFEGALLSSAAFRGFSFSTGAQTDKLGNFNVNVPAGTYFIHVYASQTGLINPEEQKVTVEAGKTADINLSFRSPDTLIKGTVFLETTPAESFVGAWSEKGGYLATKADASGKYSFKVNKNDTWRVYASREFRGDWYRSSETTVKITTETEFVQDLVLVRERSIAPPVTTAISADKPAVVSTDDGAKVAVPANSVATSGGATISINPDAEIPKQGNTNVVGVGYEVNAFDDKGKSVTSLNTAVTITIPYDPKELEKKGIKPEDLKIAFFDDTAGVWKELKASIVNEKENTVSAVVDHLTRFAIVAAADITPPAAPSDFLATPVGGGKIKLSWKNPAKDFSHAKIYRSEKSGLIGEIRAAEVFASEFTDEGLADGLTYYYIARAVDPAGNESGNKEQATVKAQGTSAAKKLTLLVGQKVGIAASAKKATAETVVMTGGLSRNLAQGAKGEDIKTLQDFLNKSGLYPEGIISGFFGGLTKQAVIRFQEKYASEILAPAGLAKGSGFVGTGTRKKINELLGK